MVKRFWKLYRSVILCVAICIAVLACSAGYTVGVVGMNNVIAQIDVNIGSIEAYLEPECNETADRGIQRGLFCQDQNYCHAAVAGQFLYYR